MADVEKAFKTNFHGPMNINRAVLPKLCARGTGWALCYTFRLRQLGMLTQVPRHTAQASAVECLAKELAIFAPSIKLLVVKPGYFRTKAFDKIDHVEARVPEYAQFNAAVRETEAQLGCMVPGDPDKAVSAMIDLVRSQGVAAGKTVPLRMPLGSDGLARIRAKREEMVNVCDEWEGVAKSTDIVPTQ